MIFAFYSFLFLLTAVYVLFLFRMRGGLRTLAVKKNSEQKVSLSVTLIIPLRNEVKVLSRLQTSLRAQQYSAGDVEVLFVDDHSDDGTADELRALTSDKAEFRVLSLPAAMAGKKDAITYGVQHARGEIIITTDADCIHPPGWVAAMAFAFSDGVGVVAGPVVYDDRSTLFMRLQAVEFLGLVGVGAGFFGIGFPRLCNGANFAYRREAFLQAGGYENNKHIHSGDDSFLLYDIVYRQGNDARFIAAADAVVSAKPAENGVEFVRQRIRWVSKSRHEADRRFVSFLILLFFYFVMMALLPVVIVYAPYTVPFAVAAAVVKFVQDAKILFATAALLRRPVRILDMLIGEILHPYYIVFVSIIGGIGVFSWKGRKLKNH